MIDRIYMIAYVSRDDDNYRREDVDESYGFFLTEEEAQSWVDGHHVFEDGYQRYLSSVEESNARKQKEFEVRSRVWDEMKAEGVEPGFFKPQKAQVITPQTFVQFVRDNERYCVVEVERADV